MKSNNKFLYSSNGTQEMELPKVESDIMEYGSLEYSDESIYYRLNEEEVIKTLRQGSLNRKELNGFLDKVYQRTFIDKISKEFKNLTKTEELDEPRTELMTYDYGKIILEKLIIDFDRNLYQDITKMKKTEKKNLQESIKSTFYTGNILSLINSVASVLLRSKQKKKLIITSEKNINFWNMFLEKQKSVNVIRDRASHKLYNYEDLEKKYITVVTHEYLSSQEYKETWSSYLNNKLNLKECFNNQKMEIKMNQLWDVIKSPNLGLVNWSFVVIDNEPINEYLNHNNFKTIMDQIDGKKKMLIVDQHWEQKHTDEDYYKIYKLMTRRRGFWSGKKLSNFLFNYKFMLSCMPMRSIGILEMSKDESKIFNYYLKEFYSATENHRDSQLYLEFSKKVDRMINTNKFESQSSYVRNKANNFIKNQELDKNKEDYECVICAEALSTKSAIITECGHIYHLRCLLKSLKNNNQCPMCRHRLNMDRVFPLINKNKKAQRQLENYLIKSKKNHILIGDNLNIENENIQLTNLGKLNKDQQNKFIKKYNKEITGYTRYNIILNIQDRHLINKLKGYDAIIFTETYDLIKQGTNEVSFLGLGDSSCLKKNIEIMYLCYDTSIEKEIIKLSDRNINEIKVENIKEYLN